MESNERDMLRENFDLEEPTVFEDPSDVIETVAPEAAEIVEAVDAPRGEETADATEPAAPAEPPKKPEKKPLALELEDMRSRLQNVLGVRTTLQGTPKRGRVILQYGSEEELETIYAALERLENN